MPDLVMFSGVVSAFLTGLIGSVHCIGMCGGIVGTLTLQLPADIRQSPLRLLPYLLTYNIGRITSYTIAGFLIGLLGNSFAAILPDPKTISIYVTGTFMIALGIYLGAWWPTLSWLEKLGAKLWRWIEPFGKHFFPINSPLRMVGVGLIWGWLPCGLVYSALVLSLSASIMNDGGAPQAALLMFAFGLGTLPILLATGSATHWFTKLARNPWMRRAAGILVIAFGIYMMAMPQLHMHQDPSAEHAEHM